jgi:hypothetical protein
VRRLVPVALLLVLAGCGGGDNGSAVEQEEFVLELEIPLISDLDEPDVYGQAGISPNGRNGTRVVIRLDDPHPSKMEALIRRGGCGSFRGAVSVPDFELGEVNDGKLETEVDAPTYDLRRTGYALVVREPLSEEDLEKARDRLGPGVFEKGVCGDLTSAERVEDV